MGLTGQADMEQNYGLIELFFVFGAVLILLVYELVSVRRSLRESVKTTDQSGDSEHQSVSPSRPD